MTWMAWTPQTATFFIAIGAAISAMTVWELLQPTQAGRGFLPMATTRGDRFFISLLSAAFIHLLWLAAGLETVWIASVASISWAVVLMRWG